MAEEGGGDGTNLFQDMFKTFPVTSIIIMVVLVYLLWRSTGGIERGEQRRADGQTSIFLEVRGVPNAYDNQEVFSAVPVEDFKRDPEE